MSFELRLDAWQRGFGEQAELPGLSVPIGSVLEYWRWLVKTTDARYRVWFPAGGDDPDTREVVRELMP